MKTTTNKRVVPFLLLIVKQYLCIFSVKEIVFYYYLLLLSWRLTAIQYVRVRISSLFSALSELKKRSWKTKKEIYFELNMSDNGPGV